MLTFLHSLPIVLLVVSLILLSIGLSIETKEDDIVATNIKEQFDLIEKIALEHEVSLIGYGSIHLQPDIYLLNKILADY